MTLQRRILPALILLSAIACYLAQEQLGLPRDAAFFFKPLTTILIIVLAWARGRDTPLLRRWVIAGLVCSLAGDTFLLWPQYFVPGLLAFLAAHLAYLWAFTRVRRLAAWPWSFVGYGLVAAGVLAYLWPGITPALRGPVVAYVLCLSAMAAQAAVIGKLEPGAGLLALGGALFFMSDGCLALNKFAGPVPWASLAVLPTYWAAQCCIALWLRRPSTSP
ncbi:lysoplasmalogenase [Pelomonas sp. KK5]|uniref:lysoplasmalogenase n=1 Tax=Pelomonas sp. KK5 TaxID=1855730 RepID=UPI0009F9AD7E|nr:lysoplasmalogenase [Pelomonas sp. KK5]